jgi:hypothetical protein
VWNWWIYKARNGDSVGPFWADENSALRMRPATMPWDANLYKYVNKRWETYL